MNYSFLALQNSPPSMHPRGSIYIPPIGNGVSIRSVSRHMEGQESSYSGLNEENFNFFCFYPHFPMYVGIGLKAACTRGYYLKSHVYK